MKGAAGKLPAPRSRTELRRCGSDEEDVPLPIEHERRRPDGGVENPTLSSRIRLARAQSSRAKGASHERFLRHRIRTSAPRCRRRANRIWQKRPDGIPQDDIAKDQLPHDRAANQRVRPAFGARAPQAKFSAQVDSRHRADRTAASSRCSIGKARPLVEPQRRSSVRLRGAGACRPRLIELLARRASRMHQITWIVSCATAPRTCSTTDAR